MGGIVLHASVLNHVFLFDRENPTIGGSACIKKGENLNDGMIKYVTLSGHMSCADTLEKSPQDNILKGFRTFSRD